MRTMKTPLLFALLQVIILTAGAQQVAKTIPNSSTPEGLIGFLEFRPSDYGTQKHPLIVFLHGIGERGNGTTQINNVTANAIPKFCAAGATMRFTVGGVTSSFVVLSPQLSTGFGYWPPFYVREMIKYAKANLQIDTNRIYVCGLSLGGGGTWRAITDATGFDYTFDSKIAAAAPVCGTQEETDADFYATIGANHIPVWAFHSMDDGTVPVGCTQHAEILGNMTGVNSPAIKFTYYQTGGHSGAWINAFDTGHITRTTIVGGVATSFTANPNLYEWFLMHTRETFTAPTASAGPAKTIVLPVSSVTLNGTAAGTGSGVITSYSWTKISGPAGESIQTPAAVNTTISSLTQGVYVFRLTVTDNHGLSTSSNVTITVLGAPVANPGAAQTVAAATANLNAAGSFSPNGPIASYVWTQVSGPAATLTNANTATPVASSLVGGATYGFQLTITDNAGASASALTSVTVMFDLLPASLKYFEGSSTGNGNIISWATAAEQGTGSFDIQRSTDGINFNTIGSLPFSGNPGGNVYSFTDAGAGHTYYYRLVETSGTGKPAFSKSIVVARALKTGMISAFPNPVMANLAIALNNDSKGTTKIIVHDPAGRVVQSQSLVKSGNQLNAVINMSGLPKGIYMVEVVIGNAFRSTQNVLKQ